MYISLTLKKAKLGSINNINYFIILLQDMQNLNSNLPKKKKSTHKICTLS